LCITPVARGVFHNRIRFQAIQRRNFTGERTQRSHLDIALFGHLLKLGIAVLKLLFFIAELIEVRHLHQHASIRAGDACQAQNSDNCPGNKDVQILNRDRNLPKLAVFSAGYKQNV